MNRLKYSLTCLLVGTAAMAVSITSLVFASVFWASFCLSIAIFTLAIGILGLVYRRGAKRAFWLGFTLFGCSYFVLVFAPGFDHVIGHRLVTTKILGYIEPSVRRTEDPLRSIFSVSARAVATNPMQEALYSVAPDEGYPPQWSHFQQAGHAGFSLLIAAAGGLVCHAFLCGLTLGLAAADSLFITVSLFITAGRHENGAKPNGGSCRHSDEHGVSSSCFVPPTQAASAGVILSRRPKCRAKLPVLSILDDWLCGLSSRFAKPKTYLTCI